MQTRFAELVWPTHTQELTTHVNQDGTHTVIRTHTKNLSSNSIGPITRPRTCSFLYDLSSLIVRFFLSSPLFVLPMPVHVRVMMSVQTHECVGGGMRWCGTEVRTYRHTDTDTSSHKSARISLRQSEVFWRDFFGKMI